MQCGGGPGGASEGGDAGRLLPVLVTPTPVARAEEEEAVEGEGEGASPAARSDVVRLPLLPPSASPGVGVSGRPGSKPRATPTAGARSNNSHDTGGLASKPGTPSVGQSGGGSSSGPPVFRLNPQQVAAVLKSFWAELILGNLKAVKKLLAENHHKMDFNAARYAANADGGPLHLAAQYGHVAIARVLVHDYGLHLNARNKVGSTPLHVACKFAQKPMVTWLLEQQAAVDVPDLQFHTALDVAPYAVLDACILGPMRDEHAELTRRESEWSAAHRQALEDWEMAEARNRQTNMTLIDLESQWDEEQHGIAEARRLDGEWDATLQAREDELAGLLARQEHRRTKLQRETDELQVLYTTTIRDVEARKLSAEAERDRLEQLVAATDAELARRRQLLVDQLGVFEAALVQTPGDRDVQLWAIETLLAIASDLSVAVPQDLAHTKMLLRPYTVDVVRHVLGHFDRDHALHGAALELLVTVMRIQHAQRLETQDKLDKTTVSSFVEAATTSDLSLLVGEMIVRWRSTDSECPNATVAMAFEALYYVFSWPKTPTRVLSFCRHKSFQLLGLDVLDQLNQLPSETPTSDDDDKDKSAMGRLRCHAAFLCVTMVQYGVIQPLLERGLVSIAMQSMSRIEGQLGRDIAAPGARAPLLEEYQHLVTTLGLAFSLTRRQRPVLKGDVRGDAADIDGVPGVQHLEIAQVLRCLDALLEPQGRPDDVTRAAIFWTLSLITNLAKHIGENARRIRQGLVDERCIVLSLDRTDVSPLEVISEATIACQHSELVANGLDVDSASLELILEVWIRRFDYEGRIVPTDARALDHIIRVLNHLTGESRLGMNHRSSAREAMLLTLAVAFRVTSEAASNCQNLDHLVPNDSSSVTSAIGRTLRWVVQYVDETSASYQEPHLVQLLLPILTLFHRLCDHRLEASEHDGTTNTNTALRNCHTLSRELHICAILRIFKTSSPATDSDAHALTSKVPPDWWTLRSLSLNIIARIGCTC